VQPGLSWRRSVESVEGLIGLHDRARPCHHDWLVTQSFGLVADADGSALIGTALYWLNTGPVLSDACDATCG